VTASPSAPVLGQTGVTADPDRQLDTWPAPPGDLVVTITGNPGELTAVCPGTGQPDAYRYDIRYRPLGHLVEGKSFKKFLESFRNRGIGAEDLAAAILHKLVTDVAPAAASVDLIQNARGGMVIHASARHNGGVFG
jgi:NADPH-dependent 7-cyano-7-deazaguanine reductase QueF